jgi:hypothetical protein
MTGTELNAMTKLVRNWSKRAGMVAVLALLLFGGAVLAGGQARADTPPTPPARFTGTVTIDGQPAPAGTVIEARIGGVTCGTTTVFLSGGQARYVIDVAALDPGRSLNCGTEGATVQFYVGGKLAQQTGTWRNFELNQLNLTVVTPTPTPTATPTATPTRTPTPRPPSTGQGVAAGGSSAGGALLLAALGLAALGAGAAGAYALRRAR